MSERTRPAAQRWLVTAVVAGLLGWASLHAWRAARTADDLYWALQSLRIWGVPSQFTIKDWAEKRDRLEKAQAIEPDNPQIEEYLGLFDMRRFDDPERLPAAALHYVRAVELRPVSANTWANLAEARYLMGDTGPTFRRALESAASLAPSNPQVQNAVTLYGLAVFDEVGAETRKAIDATVGAGMRRDPGMTLAIAHRRGRLDVACRYLPETKRKVEPAWQTVCAQALVPKTDASGERR